MFFTPTGILEIKGYLNGVDTPYMFDAIPLLVKVSKFICLYKKREEMDREAVRVLA